jgi:glycosyltransferase involved in cell wall biosynthesis
MRVVYASSRLVVVPSRVEETFGRVAAEAMVSGIPCVVSDRGGLPQVVGDTGKIVEDVESIDAWIDAIGGALKNHDSEAQKRRAKRFSADVQVVKLLNIINEIGV